MISKLFSIILYLFLFYFIVKTVKRIFLGVKRGGTGHVNGRRERKRFDNIEEANYTIIDEKKEDQK